MTKKHFIALARAIAETEQPQSPVAQTVRALIAQSIADICRAENSNFDRERFLAACKVASR